MDISATVARLVERAGIRFTSVALMLHPVIIRHLAAGGPTDWLDAQAVQRIALFA